MKPVYDLIIIGAGCAGLAAGVYAGRAKLKTLILEKSNPGGQVGNTAEVVNYPGIRKTGGPELVDEMKNHVRDFGVKIETAEIERVDLTGEIKTLYAKSGTYQSRAVIIATGAAPRRGGFGGEDTYTGHGVAYCATCDGEFFSGLDIFVVGGGYAAAEEAIYLTRFAKSVTIVIRGKDFSCARSVAEKVLAHPKITVKFNTLLEQVAGDSLLRKAYLKDKLTGETTVYDAGPNGTFGVFVFVGYDPATEVFRDQVEVDEHGYILTDDAMKTNLPGVFAAGDLRPKILRQIVTAVSDGAVAATSAEKYVTEEKERLGLPMFEEEAAPAEEPAESAGTSHQADGEYLNGELKGQLEQVFQRLTRDMTIVTVVDSANPKSLELEGFLREVTALSPRIGLNIVAKGEDAALEQNLGIERYPVAALLDEAGQFSGVKFSGVPGGHEINSFVLAILHLGSEDKLTPEQLEKIQALPENTKLRVGITLSCPYCPDVVAAAHSIAIASNGKVTAEMIDVALFPDIREKYQIMSVPALLLNDDPKAVFGSQSLDQILELAAKN
ncbi:FAD-dependent oxidoreductase [Clostridium minihomine]|uniref:FAD-dependent oxidoreductase n=1 Tax=Clostridium minihomine TaxID=2045012 RepID=UPI000C764DD3|nr:FAD-dependent oxidoreductase [Clostridium minihomine]